MVRLRFAVVAVAVVVLVCVFGTLAGWSYTQSGASIFDMGSLTPMGHEWITRMAAIELLVYNGPPDPPDPEDRDGDPRKGWTQGLAKNIDLSGAQGEVRRIKQNTCTTKACEAYKSRYKPVYDAIVGERWVDIAGYNVLPGKVPKIAKDCFDAVAQEPAEVQNDHFMRRYDDVGGAGGVNAAYNSQVRFIKYFVAAAMAPPTIMNVYDGGASGSTAVDVDRNYFLFGRAVHLFEDSFSPEHTVRSSTIDNYTRVRQVKSYLCAKGSEQHSHLMPTDKDFYKTGDVIWITDSAWDPGWPSYKPVNMRANALVAEEATKDLWAAFIRTMATDVSQREAAAVAEANTLVKNWLNYDENEMKTWYDDPNHRDDTYVLLDQQSGKGQTQQACMQELNGTDDQLAEVHRLEALQRVCLYNAVPWSGFEDLFDTSTHIWFSWRWLTWSPLNWINGGDTGYDNPPAGWQIPDLPADSGIRVRVKSVANGQYMSAAGGIAPDAWVYNKPGQPPLDFILVGSKDQGMLRVASDPRLFLSYVVTNPIPTYNGAAKLFWFYNRFDPTSWAGPTTYKISNLPGLQGPQWSIMSTYYSQYMYLYDKYQSPYVDRNGGTAGVNARWFFEPTGGDTALGKCCWDRQVQGCSLDSTCDPGGEGCVYSGMSTKQYGAFQCNVAKCCWDRLLQSCKQNSDCDSGGEGCVTSGTNTFTYGRFQCNTCEMQGQVYDPKTQTCKPKLLAEP
jgi:hypothetical protein